MNEWMNKMNEWMNEWTNECMNESKSNGTEWDEMTWDGLKRDEWNAMR